MAININIDDQLGLEYMFKIAGKKRGLIYDDECALEIQRVELTVAKSFKRIQDLDDDDLDNLEVDDQLDIVRGAYADIRKAVIPFFDKYFGEGAGQEIYEYYHESTHALGAVFGEINGYLEKVKINDKKK